MTRGQVLRRIGLAAGAMLATFGLSCWFTKTCCERHWERLNRP